MLIQFDLTENSINKIVRKVRMALQDDVNAIIGKLDQVATDAVTEKNEVLGALNDLNTKVADGNVKLEAAQAQITDLQKQIADLQAQQPAVDLSGLSAKVDSLDALVKDIYVKPADVPPAV
jgi:phage shock protein A